MSQKLSLPNGCSMSTPIVNPKNWKTGGLNLIKKDWHIQYYFYERNSKKGRLISIRGMNSYKDLKERREVTQIIMDDEIEDNKLGFNPITKKFVKDTNLNSELNPNLFFIDAFRNVLPKIQSTEKHKKEVGWCIDRLEKNVVKVGLQKVIIEQLTRRQFKQLLEVCNLPNTKCPPYQTVTITNTYPIFQVCFVSLWNMNAVR